jgi:hypothetical protein
MSSLALRDGAIVIRELIDFYLAWRPGPPRLV